MALDVGDRRIGLAVTDPLGIIAQPLFTVHRTTLRADLKAIARFVRKGSCLSPCRRFAFFGATTTRSPDIAVAMTVRPSQA